MEDDQNSIVENKYIAPYDAVAKVNKDAGLMNSGGICNVSVLNTDLDGAECRVGTEIVRCCVSDSGVQNLPCSSLPASVRICLRKLPEAEMESNQPDLIAESNPEVEHCSLSTYLGGMLTKAERKRHADSLLDCETQKKLTRIEEPAAEVVEEICEESTSTALGHKEAENAIKNLIERFGKRKIISVMKDKSDGRKPKRSTIEKFGNGKTKILKNQMKLLDGLAESGIVVTKGAAEAEMGTRKKPVKARNLVKKSNAKVVNSLKKRPTKAKDVLLKRQTLGKAGVVKPEKARRIAKTGTVNAEKALKRKPQGIVPEEANGVERASKTKPEKNAEKLHKKSILEADEKVKKKPARTEDVIKRSTNANKVKPSLANRIVKKKPVNAEIALKKRPAEAFANKVETSSRKRPEKAEDVDHLKVFKAQKEAKNRLTTANEEDLEKTAEDEAGANEHPDKSEFVIKQKACEAERTIKKRKVLQAGNVRRSNKAEKEVRREDGAETIRKTKVVRAKKVVQKKAAKTVKEGVQRAIVVEKIDNEVSAKMKNVARKKSAKTEKVAESKKRALKSEKVVEKKAAEGVKGKEGNTKNVVKKKATATVSESRKEETVRYTLVNREKAETKIGVKRKMTGEMSEILSTRTKKTNIEFKRSLPESLNKVNKTNINVLRPKEMSEILSTRTKKTNMEFKRSLPESISKVNKTNVAVLRPKKCRIREFKLTAVKKTRVELAAEVGTLLKQNQQEQRKTDVSFINENEAEMEVGENNKLVLHPVDDAIRSEHRFVYSCSLQRDENSCSLQSDENSCSLQRDDSNENCLQMQDIDPVLCDAKTVALNSSFFEGQDISHHADELQVEVLDYTVLKQKKIDPDASVLVKEAAETLTPEKPSFSETRIHVEDHANDESLQSLQRDNQGRQIIGSVYILLPTHKSRDASMNFGEGVENQVMVDGGESVVPEVQSFLNDSLKAAEGHEIDIEMNPESRRRLSDKEVCARVQEKAEPCYESKPFILNAEVQCVEEKHKPDVLSNFVCHSSEAQQVKTDDINDSVIMPRGGIAISAENPYTCLVTIEPLPQNAKNFGGLDAILSAGVRNSFAAPQQAHQPKNVLQPQKHTRLDDIAGKLWKIKLEAVEHANPAKKTAEITGIQNQCTSSASELNTVVDNKSILDASVHCEHSYSRKQSTVGEATVPKEECSETTQVAHFLSKPARASNECTISDSVCHTTEQQLSADADSKRFTTLAADYLNSLITPIESLKTALLPSVAKEPAFEPAKAVVSFQNVATISEMQFNATKHLQSFSGLSEKHLPAVTDSHSSKLLSEKQSSAGMDSQNVTSMTEKLRKSVTLAKSITTTSEDKLSDGAHSRNVAVKSEKPFDVVSSSRNITDLQGKQLKAVTHAQNVTVASGKWLNAVSFSQSVTAIPEQLNTVAHSQSGVSMSEEESKVVARSQSIAAMPAEQLKSETTPITHSVLVMPKEYLYGFTQPARLMLVPDQNYSATEQEVRCNRVPNVGAPASVVAYDVAQSQGITLTNPGDYYSSFLQHPGFPVVLQGDNCNCLQAEMCCNAAQSQVRRSNMLQFQNDRLLPCGICYAVVQSQDGNANVLQMQSNTPEATCCDVSQVSQVDNGNVQPLHNDTCLSEHNSGQVYYFLEPSDNKTDMVEDDIDVNRPQSESDALLAEEVCYFVESDDYERKMAEDDNVNHLQLENDVLLAEEVCCLVESDGEDEGKMAEDENACEDVNGLRRQNDAFLSGEMCCFVESSEYETNEDVGALRLQNDALLPEEVHCMTTEFNNLTDDGRITLEKADFMGGPSQNFIREQSKKKLSRRQCKSLAAAKENSKDVEEKIQRRSTLGLRITPQRVTPFQFDHKGVTGKTDETPEASEDSGDVMSKLLQSLVKSNQKTTNPKKDLVEQQEPANKQRNRKPPPLVSFRVGELVWARLSFQRFWPAIVVDPLSCGQSSTKPGYCWVFWFGDYKVSEVPLAKVLPFASNFSTKYVKSERKTYETGILEAVKELADRADGTVGGVVKSNKDLIAWASSLTNSEVHNKWTLRLPNWILEKLEKIRLAQIELRDSDTEPDVCRRDKSNANNATSEFGQGIQSITDICIVCHRVLIGLHRYQHPFFNGGLCPSCRETILQSIFFFDSDGTNSYCIICGFGKEVFVCEVVGCNKVYCTDCIGRLAGEGIVEAIRKTDGWSCFLCATYDPAKHGLLEGKREWRSNLASLSHDSGIDLFPNKAVEDRQPIRVLSLFDGIGTGKLVLDHLKIQIERYCASEVEQDAITVAQIRHRGLIRHLGDVRDINRHTLEGLGPIDLLIGGSPCNELSVANPCRRGLEAGSGLLFFEFVRILRILKDQNKTRPLFWIYENVASMNEESRSIISRMFECEPALWDAKYFSAQRRARYFWGNIPGMYCPLQYSASEAGGSLEDHLFPTRKAKVQKVRTITTQRNSLLMDRNKDDSFPVTMGDADDSLWIPEVERIFGFPEHYTDVANLSASRRLKLLGQSWSVPVIRHLLSPLCNYFQTTSNAAETVSGAPVANNSEANVTTMHVLSATASSTTNAAGCCN